LSEVIFVTNPYMIKALEEAQLYFRITGVRYSDKDIKERAKYYEKEEMEELLNESKIQR